MLLEVSRIRYTRARNCRLKRLHARSTIAVNLLPEGKPEEGSMAMLAGGADVLGARWVGPPVALGRTFAPEGGTFFRKISCAEGKISRNVSLFQRIICQIFFAALSAAPSGPKICANRAKIAIKARLSQSVLRDFVSIPGIFSPPTPMFLAKISGVDGISHSRARISRNFSSLRGP